MEDQDDFELVENDEKMGFDEFVDDEDLLKDDDLGKISELNKEMKEVRELKKRLKLQCAESSKIMKQLKEATASTEATQAQLQKEITSMKEMKASMEQEKLEFEKQKQEMSQLLESLTGAPATVADCKSLRSQLESEVKTLHSLRAQQQEMVNQCKIHIETLRSDQKNCLLTLDQSLAFSCKECGTHIAVSSDIESKCYQVGQGAFTEKKRGYLFKKAVNVTLGAQKQENFTTGSYQISWASCAKCNTQLGWKYISADNANNSAKVGKFCLARYSLCSPEDRAQAK